MDPFIIALLTLASFVAGFVDAVAGGGGLILMPSLLVAGIPPQMVLGTNKFAGMSGTATALINFSRNKKVIWKIAFVGLLFSLVGSVLGTRAILYFNQATTATIIVYLLPVAAVITFVPKKQLKTSSAEISNLNLYLHIPVTCLVIGFYDGFFGPGTGTFLIFAFYILMGLHLINASAVAKVFNLASNVGSFFTFLLAHKVLFSVGIPIALANITGGYIGSKLAIQKGQGFIKAFLVIVFVILFTTLLQAISK
ncbi:MAG: TSUP family transporter [Desulfobacteraceae bacterium]|nr:TSUP family transporter [Desulfobacteraceae bacterium]